MLRRGESLFRCRPFVRSVPRKIREKRDCPKDWVPLRRERRDVMLSDVEVDACPKCEGIFLDRKEIKALTGSSDLHKLLTKYLGLDSDSQLICPNCGGLMDAEDAGDVRVDVCIKCHGVWLDAGELKRLTETDDAEFRNFPPEKIAEILKAQEIRANERRKATRSLFRGSRRR
jgi:Zn-finger nucleic acid-binding protein